MLLGLECQAVPFANQALQVRLGTFPKSDAFEAHVAAQINQRAEAEREVEERASLLTDMALALYHAIEDHDRQTIKILSKAIPHQFGAGAYREIREEIRKELGRTQLKPIDVQRLASEHPWMYSRPWYIANTLAAFLMVALLCYVVYENQPRVLQTIFIWVKHLLLKDGSLAFTPENTITASLKISLAAKLAASGKVFVAGSLFGDSHAGSTPSEFDRFERELDLRDRLRELQDSPFYEKYMEEVKERGRDFNQGYTWGHLDDHANVLDRVQLLAGPLRGKRVLEVGAGPGYVQKAMHDMGESIEGWERNGLLVDLAASHRG